MENKNYEILITTCKAFSDMWMNINTLYDKNWPTHPKLTIVSDYDDPNISIDKTNIIFEDGDYSFRLLAALSKIKSKYVFLSLDDYYPCKPVNDKAFEHIIDLMEKHNLDYFRLFRRSKTKYWFDKKENLKLLTLKESIYEMNLYPSVWKKESLINIIKKDENIWKFEVRITRRSRELNYKCVSTEDKNIFRFVDVIRKGKYLRKAYSFIKKNNLYLSDREKRTIWDEMFLYIKTIASRHLPPRIKIFIKKHTKGPYYADYANDDD